MNERKWVGLGLMVLGVALILGLEALVNLSTDTSDYALIERRIPGGTVLGFGLGVFHLRSWNNKVAFFANVFAWLTVGALIGRISGILPWGATPFSIGFGPARRWLSSPWPLAWRGIRKLTIGLNSAQR